MSVCGRLTLGGAVCSNSGSGRLLSTHTTRQTPSQWSVHGPPPARSHPGQSMCRPGGPRPAGTSVRSALFAARCWWFLVCGVCGVRGVGTGSLMCPRGSVNDARDASRTPSSVSASVCQPAGLVPLGIRPGVGWWFGADGDGW